MRKSSRVRSVLAGWMVLGGISLGAVEIKSHAQAVDMMGKERMLVMRMLKDTVMIGMKMNYHDPAGELKKTMESFEETQQALKSYVTDPKIKAKLEEIDAKWAQAKKLLSEPPKKERAKEYLKTMVGIRELANDATNMMSGGKKDGANMTINLAGRLRAVSQALASIYLLETWGMEGARKKLEIPMKRFRGSLDHLEKVPETDEKAKKMLKKLEKTYLFFEVMKDAETFTPTLVVSKTDRMFKDAAKLTQHYVELLKK